MASPEVMQLIGKMGAEEQDIMSSAGNLVKAKIELENAEDSYNTVDESYTKQLNNSNYRIARNLLYDGNLFFDTVKMNKYLNPAIVLGAISAVDFFSQVYTGNYRHELVDIAEVIAGLFGGMSFFYKIFVFDRWISDAKSKWDTVLGKGMLTEENLEAIKTAVERYEAQYDVWNYPREEESSE